MADDCRQPLPPAIDRCRPTIQGLAFMTLNRPLGRHIPFYIAAALGIAAFAVALAVSPPVSSTAGATAFFVAYIVLVLRDMPLLTETYLRKNARKTDLPV